MRLIRHISRFARWLTATRRRKILSSTLAVLIVLTSIRFIFLRPKDVKAGWYDDAWQYRKLLTVDHNDVSGSTDFANFPIMVARTDTDLRDKAQTDADDVIFVGIDNKKLDHEIESYNSGTGEIVAWVKIPTLYATQATTFYMYYGNPSAVNSENAAGVWKDYSAVWHLSESSGTRSDSSPNGNNLTDNNTVTSNPGKAGTAAQFTRANNEYLSITETTSLSVADQDFMVSGWVYLDTEPTFTGFGEQSASGNIAWIAQRDAANDTLSFSVSNDGSSLTTQACTGFGTITTATWYYFIGWHDSVNNSIGCRINTTQNTRLYTTGVYNSTAPIELGRLNTGIPSYWDGRIDEFRFQKSIRSSDWLTTEYNNMNDNPGFFSSVGSEEKGPGPTSWWKFDEGQGTLAQDSASGNNDGSISGASWKTDDLCQSEKCLFFDGTDDVVTVTNANSIDFDLGLSGGFTIQTWVRVNSDGENSTGEIFDKGTGTYLRIDTEGGDALADLEANLDLVTTDANVNITNGITLNRWHHVAVVHDGSNTITVYIDGANRGSNTGSGGKSSDANNLLIGGDTLNNFHGFIDEFKVYNYQRSGDEIKTDFLKLAGPHGSSATFGDTKAYLSDGLVGYWKMEESATPATDSSGNGGSGTWTGNVARTGAKFGYGTTYDGTGDYISVADSTYLSPTSQVTITAWLNPSTSIATKAIVVKDTAYRLVTGSSGNPICQIHNGSSWQTAATSSTALSLSSWQHVGCTYDGTTARVFVNGSQTGSASYSVSIADNANALRIGSDSGGTYGDFNGKQDEVRIYNRALSPAEISSLFNWGPGPVAYWKLDENTGTTANDSSGNNNNSQAFNGDTTWTTGKYGSGLTLDGNADYVPVNDPGTGSVLDFDNATSITISAWIYPTAAFNDYFTILTKGLTNATDDFNYWFGIPSDNCTDTTHCGLTFSYRSGFDIQQFNTTATNLITTNAWQHVAVTYTFGTASSVRVYVNGVQYTAGSWVTGTGNGPPNQDDDPLWIGADDFGACGGSCEEFVGRIDDVQIYNYARTPAQIIEDMNAGHPAPGSPFGSAVAWWKFDEGYGDTANNSGTGGSTDNGNLAGTTNCPQSVDSACPTWTNNGKFGKALDFDTAGTTDDYIDVGDPSNLDPPANNITLSAWINMDVLPGANDYGIVTKGSAWGLEIETDTDCIDFWIYQSTTIYELQPSCPFSLSTSTWYHFVGTFDGDSLRVYINGQLVSTSDVAATGIDSSTSSIYIGQTSGFPGRFFEGKIDDVRIYAFALTPAQVKILYNQGSATVWGATSTYPSGNASWSSENEYCPPGQGSACTSPIAHWKLDENTGTSSVNDISGNDNTLTMNNFEETDWVPGKYGATLEFDGSNKTLSRADDADFDFDTGAFTVEAWVKHDGAIATNEDYILTKADTTNGGYKIYMDNSGDFCFAVDDDATWTPDASACTSAVDYDDNAWHHVVGVKVATNDIRLYVDGSQVANNTTSVTGTLSNTNSLYIGVDRDGTSNAWDGQIDEIKIYNYARNSAQVAWDYNRGGPVGWWKMDENTGSTAYDSSGKASNGTITGATYISGKRNYALDFDGTDDNVDMNDVALFDFNDQDFTISGWFNRDTFNTDDTIVAKRNGVAAADIGYIVYIDDATDKLTFEVSDGTDEYQMESTSTFTSTGWNHFVIVWDDDSATNSKIYINGFDDNESHTGTIGNIGNLSNAVDFRVGGESDIATDSPFDGKLDDVQIFNYALTRQQALTLYNSGVLFFGPSEGTF